MNIKNLLPIALLIVASSASANGLSIDNVEKHMNAAQWTQTSSTTQDIVVQGPLDAFEAYQSAQMNIVETERFQHSFAPQS